MFTRRATIFGPFSSWLVNPIKPNLFLFFPFPFPFFFFTRFLHCPFYYQPFPWICQCQITLNTAHTTILFRRRNTSLRRRLSIIIRTLQLQQQLLGNRRHLHRLLTPTPNPNWLLLSGKIKTHSASKSMHAVSASPDETVKHWKRKRKILVQTKTESWLLFIDNDMINGTKLLNVAGISRGKRDGILKNEKTRVVVKVGAMHLKGVWYVIRSPSQDLAAPATAHP